MGSQKENSSILDDDIENGGVDVIALHHSEHIRENIIDSPTK